MEAGEIAADSTGADPLRVIASFGEARRRPNCIRVPAAMGNGELGVTTRFVQNHTLR